ncbi:MAG: response regulator [Flavisolibacter sp.]
MILIVDDRPENIFSLKSILERNGFETDSALSGEEALKKVLNNDYELIILDVQMPMMDGYEVAEELTGYGKTKDVPIIFLSAVNTDKKFITKGYQSGGIDYVTKPVDPDILLLKVHSFTRLYRQTKELKNTRTALQEEVDVRKRAEKALQEHVNELLTVLSSIPQIAFTADADGHIQYVNEQWLQYAPSAKEFPTTHPGEPSLELLWYEAVKAGEPVDLEVSILQKSSGNYLYHLLRAVPVISDGHITKWIGTFTNIHHQKSINEVLEQKVVERTYELIKTNKELEESNYDLQHFASVASHDLKEPLRKIQTFISIIKSRDLTKEKLDYYFEKIGSSSSRMTQLITDLLEFSRLSEKHEFETTDLNEVFRDVLADLELSISEKNARITIGQLPEVEVVPGLMRQVFQNIISNALKFSHPDRTPEIKVSGDTIKRPDVDAPSDAAGTFCRVAIADNGIGFEEEYRDKIFTLFQRLHAREEYEGTGIGLAIAKKIMDMHGGMITATAVPNEGSTFYIILPLRQPTIPAKPKPLTARTHE